MSKQVVQATTAARKELMRQVAKLDRVLATLAPQTKTRKRRGPNKPRRALGETLVGVTTDAPEPLPEAKTTEEFKQARAEAPASTVRAVPRAPKPRPVAAPKGPLARKQAAKPVLLRRSGKIGDAAVANALKGS